MKNAISAFAILALLSACGSSGTNPHDTNTTDTGDGTAAEGAIPEELADDLASFKYNSRNQTLTVTGIGQDSSPLSATYTRNAALDTAGYEAYTTQDDALFRHVIALVKETNNSGSVRAGVVSTGGQVNRIRHGGYYERDGNFNKPKSGHVRYVGSYAGLTNVQTNGDLITPIPGAPDDVLPGQSVRTRGQILINVDFNDSTVEGIIFDRSLIERDETLPSIALIGADIADDGTFYGEEVQYEGVVDGDIGDYGGIFGGPKAEGVGGVVSLDEFDNDELEWEGEVETGVFVLDQCGTDAATSPLCSPNAN